MATPRDPAVTEYVRWRVRQVLDREEMTSAQLAAKAGVSPATISQLWKTGVGGRSIDGFATFLGFRGTGDRTAADAMRDVAYEWWRNQGPKTESRWNDPGVQEAVQRIRSLQPWFPEEQIRTILHRFAHPDFDGRDSDYWFMTIGVEIAQDAKRAQLERAEKSSQASKKRQEKKVIQGAFREAAALTRQKEAEELERLSPPPPPPASSAPKAAIASNAVRAKRR